jgi:hypothetical protein
LPSPNLNLPHAAPVVRANGDSVLELTQNGELVGEVNFTKIIANWFDALGIIKKPRHLTTVR